MKISKKRLEKIIKEEIKRAALNENPVRTAMQLTKDFRIFLLVAMSPTPTKP